MKIINSSMHVAAVKQGLRKVTLDATCILQSCAS